MCLVIIFTFSIVKPKQEAEAVAPLVAGLLSVLASVALDIAVDMGIQFVDKKMAKAKAEKVAKKIWDKHGDKIKTLVPTKKNISKWSLKIPKWLVAAIVDEWGDTAKEVPKKDKEREEENNKKFDEGFKTEKITGETDPFYKTDISVTVKAGGSGVGEQASYAYLLKYGRVELTPKAYEQRTEAYLCVSDQCRRIGGFLGGSNVEVQTSNYRDSSIDFLVLLDGQIFNSHSYVLGSNYQLFEAYKRMLSNSQKRIYEFDGVVVSDGFDSFIDLDDNLTADQIEKIDFDKLPDKYKYDREYEFDLEPSLGIDLGGIADGDDFEWELIEKDIEYKVKNETIYNEYNYTYNITINNDYTLTDKEQGDIDNEVGVITPPGNGSGSGDSGMVCTEDGQIIPCKKVEKIDGSLLAYVKNAYEYATGFVKTATDGLKALGTGAVELTKLYGVFFGWLPKEIVVLMSSGLAIMLGLRIFRK